MLIPFRFLRGCTVRARDGKEGVVDDLLFDERTWSAVHVVVKVGSWFTRRKVLLAREWIVGIDRETGELEVDLDVRDIREGPGIECHPPRSRQRRLAYMDAYRHWLPFGGRAGLSPVGTQGTSDRRFDDRDVRHTRSARELRGYGLQACDRPSGFITDLVVEDVDWSLPALAVSARLLMSGSERLIDSNTVTNIDLAQRRVRVRLAADEVARSPALTVSDGVIQQPEQSWSATR